MRAFALSGFAALAISMMAPATVWAWSSEPVAPRGADGANLVDSDDPLKALQDKVNAKDGLRLGSQNSGFYMSGGAAQQQTFGPYGGAFRSSTPTDTTAFGWSPQPGFRGPAN
jgi:hypothetical protein